MKGEKMETWKRLKGKPVKTSEEKILILAIEKLHSSKTLETVSEEAVYTVLCGKAGVNIEETEQVEKKPRKKTAKKKTKKKSDS